MRRLLLQVGGAARVRNASRRFVWIALAMLLLVVLGIGWFWIGLASAPAEQSGGLVPPGAVLLLPSFFHVWALIALGVTFRDIARGRMFAPAVERGLRQLGWALIGSGVASSVIVPVLAVTVLRNAAPDSEHVRGQVDGAHLMLILVGIAVLLIARLFAVAAEQEKRTESLQTELDEFV